MKRITMMSPVVRCVNHNSIVLEETLDSGEIQKFVVGYITDCDEDNFERLKTHLNQSVPMIVGEYYEDEYTKEMCLNIQVIFYENEKVLLYEDETEPEKSKGEENMRFIKTSRGEYISINSSIELYVFPISYYIGEGNEERDIPTIILKTCINDGGANLYIGEDAEEKLEFMIEKLLAGEQIFSFEKYGINTHVHPISVLKYQP